MPAPRFVLPLVIALASLSTTGSGFVAAADLRADERRERALAAERRAEQREREAVAAYQQALTPVALDFHDMVQPLQQAYGDLEDGEVSVVDVLIDISNHVVGPAGISTLTGRLAAVAPPASVQEEHERLTDALGDVVTAARPIGALENDKAPTVEGEVIADGDLDLDAATSAWQAALSSVFAGQAAPPAPLATGADGERRPLSHASYLREAGSLCSQGIDAYDKTRSGDEEPSLEEIQAGLRELTDRIPRLAAVKAAPGDDQKVATSIRAPLQRTLELGKGFDSALAAARRGEPAALRSAQAQIARGEVAAEKAAAGYRAYGSQLCALYLVGLEDEAGAEESEPTRPA